MCSAEFVQSALREHVAPPLWGSVKNRIRHAARVLGWSYSRTKDAWYADPRISISCDEMRAIEKATGLRYGRQQTQEIEVLIERADQLLARRNPHPNSALVAALRAFISALDSAGAGGARMK